MWNTRLPAVRTEDIHYNIVLVIDCSGSMYGEKMTNTIKSAQNLVDTLQDGDRVTVISFADEAKVVLPTTEIKSSPQNTRDDVAIKLGYLRAEGLTNMADAIILAAKYDTTDEGYYSFLVLLSDGQATTPVNNSMIEELSNNAQRVLAVGIGEDVDSELLNKFGGAKWNA